MIKEISKNVRSSHSAKASFSDVDTIAHGNKARPSTHESGAQKPFLQPQELQTSHDPCAVNQ